jgi:hypothetical protein
MYVGSSDAEFFHKTKMVKRISFDEDEDDTQASKVNYLTKQCKFFEGVFFVKYLQGLRTRYVRKKPLIRPSKMHF